MTTRSNGSTGDAELIAHRRELGRRIKVARVSANLSQRELAVAIKLANASDVSRYERGTQQVPDYRLDLIAEVTGRPRSFFTRDVEEVERLQGEELRLARIEAAIEEIRPAIAELRPAIAELRQLFLELYEADQVASEQGQ